MADKSSEFGLRLDDLRKKMGLTQKKLAIKVNVDQAAISNYIRLGSIPEAPILYRLSRELEVSMEDLLVGKKEETEDAPISNLRRMDDHLSAADGRYPVAKDHLYKIFQSNREDVKTAIFNNLEVFAETVTDRESPQKKKATPGK